MEHEKINTENAPGIQAPADADVGEAIVDARTRSKSILDESAAQALDVNSAITELKQDESKPYVERKFVLCGQSEDGNKVQEAFTIRYTRHTGGTYVPTKSPDKLVNIVVKADSCNIIFELAYDQAAKTAAIGEIKMNTLKRMGFNSQLLSSLLADIDMITSDGFYDEDLVEVVKNLKHDGFGYEEMPFSLLAARSGIISSRKNFISVVTDMDDLVSYRVDEKCYALLTRAKEWERQREQGEWKGSTQEDELQALCRDCNAYDDSRLGKEASEAWDVQRDYLHDLLKGKKK